jgi:chromosome segregation ATPase
MTRTLQILNLLGILALVVLCIFQWQANRRLNLQYIDLEKTRNKLTAQTTQLQSNLDGATADLNDFRARIAAGQSAAKKSDDKLAAAATQIQTLTAQQHQLQSAADSFKSTIDKWTATVAARDQTFRQAQSQVQTLAEDRNASIQKFNDLALKYNAAIEEIKKANEAIKKLAQDRNDAVQKFNDLAAKYNALAGGQPATQKQNP